MVVLTTKIWREAAALVKLLQNTNYQNLVGYQRAFVQLKDVRRSLGNPAKNFDTACQSTEPTV